MAQIQFSNVLERPEIFYLCTHGTRVGAKVKDLWSLRSSKNLRLSHICEFLKYMEGRSATEYGNLYHEAARIKRLKVQHTEGRGVSDAAVEAVMKELALTAHENCEEVPVDLHPHNYLHAYGTRRIKQGKQLAVMQREMGHMCIQSTMTYIDTSSMI